MAKLRDYQQKLLEQAVSGLVASRARVMLQLSTGGGKTHIAGALLRCWLHNGRKAAWLTHRTELADQTCEMLTDAGVSAIGVKTWQSGDDAPSVPNGAVILMAQTVGRRANRMQVWGKYGSTDLLVIDEAHHATADGWERAIGQWPGKVLGLTATPWRLSVKEGFDHLFSELYCGPQVSELQTHGWLCHSRVLVPKPEDTIRGGAINAVGEYSESGIEQANQDRPDILTAGALRFWQFHAAERQTVVYAISQDHARNLTALFNDAGIPAAVMLSDTPSQERADAIDSFGNGTVRVLVNVAVATEGFDLPDASCIVITRPTMSLALYLQMVGRGLRPKADGGDCLILDLAGNAGIHGLPDEPRQWSLEPIGSNPSGDAPVVRCAKCDAVSPAASHSCGLCQTPFGKDCPRCGTWRAWQRWSYENRCGQRHELVCNLCHYDAHIQAQLPVTDELRRVAEMVPDLDFALRNLLEEERRRAGDADEDRKSELHSLIADRESELTSDRLIRSFKDHIATLPEEARPKSELEEYRLFPEWENSLIQEISGWKAELEWLEAKAPDGLLIYNNTRERVLQVLESVAREGGLLPQTPSRRDPSTRKRTVISENLNPASEDIKGWVTFAELGEWGQKQQNKSTPVKPMNIRDPKGNEIPVRNWANLLFETANWLADLGLLTTEHCPVIVGGMNRRYLINSMPTHPNGRSFTTKNHRLSNGLHIELHWGPKSMALRSYQLLSEFGQDPAQFHVLLG